MALRKAVEDFSVTKERPNVTLVGVLDEVFVHSVAEFGHVLKVDRHVVVEGNVLQEIHALGNAGS